MEQSRVLLLLLLFLLLFLQLPSDRFELRFHSIQLSLQRFHICFEITYCVSLGQT